MLWLKDQAPHASPRGAFSNLTLKSAAACVKATSRSSTARPQEATTGMQSMPAMGLLHCLQLFGTGGALEFRLPGLIGHAVDRLAALVLADPDALGVGLFLHPVRQAVAAEAGQVHQVDVLDVGAPAQVLDQAPENGGFEFGFGLV